MADARPIGIFDSGVGGLTVARAVMDALPDESIISLGDSARYPYGPRSIDEIRGFAVEIAQELVARGVKILVIACNSIEVSAIADVAQAAQIPVVGVVDPGARTAVAASRSGVIGVIGTQATIASGAYDRAIRTLNPNMTLHSAACPSFVEHVEGGTTDDPALRKSAEIYLAPLREADVDTLILGCTHYPLISDLIADVIGSDVTLVSSAEETARDVDAVLRSEDLLAESGGVSEAVFLCTGDADQFQAIADRFMGRRVDVSAVALAGVR